MLELKRIHKTFHPHTVNEQVLFTDLNLRVEDESFISIVGSNGSGKTTLLNIICGTVPIQSGEILVGGENMGQEKEYQRYKKMGRVYQDPSLGTAPNLTLLENMSLADNKQRPYGLGSGISKGRIDYFRSQLEILGLGLENKMDTRVGTLSGGQRQAVALIMSSLTPIDFLILDEHTAALDPKTAELIMALTDKVVREKKLTALMVTHNLRYAVNYGSRLLMMNEGKIILDKKGPEKEKTSIEDVLSIFNDISIECGN